MRIIVYQGGMWISKLEFSNGFILIRLKQSLKVCKTLFVFEVIRRCAELSIVWSLFGVSTGS